MSPKKRESNSKLEVIKEKMDSSAKRGSGILGTPSKKSIVKESKRLSRRLLSEYRGKLTEYVEIEPSLFRARELGTPLLDIVAEFGNYILDTTICCREWLTAFIDADLLIVLIGVNGLAKREMEYEGNECKWGKVLRLIMSDILCERMYRDYIGGVDNSDSTTKEQWGRLVDAAKASEVVMRPRWLYRLNRAEESHARKYHDECDTKGLSCNARYRREWYGY